jgi:hypothetical protein
LCPATTFLGRGELRPEDSLFFSQFSDPPPPNGIGCTDFSNEIWDCRRPHPPYCLCDLIVRITSPERHLFQPLRQILAFVDWLIRE